MAVLVDIVMLMLDIMGLLNVHYQITLIRQLVFVGFSLKTTPRAHPCLYLFSAVTPSGLLVHSLQCPEVDS